MEYGLAQFRRGCSSCGRVSEQIGLRLDSSRVRPTAKGIDAGQAAAPLVQGLADGVAPPAEELPGLCDRVLVLAEGRIIKELTGAEITRDAVVYASYHSTEMKEGQ